MAKNLQILGAKSAIFFASVHHILATYIGTDSYFSTILFASVTGLIFVVKYS